MVQGGLSGLNHVCHLYPSSSIYGSSLGDFHMEKGLRQGDPISPLLFNIVAKGLNILLEKAKLANLISGIQMGSNGLVISCLQFADYTILFCKNNLEELKVIKGILHSFEFDVRDQDRLC